MADTQDTTPHQSMPDARFIDVFAGAGGLSLGLLSAGWKGICGIEMSPMAFETLQHNLIDQADSYSYHWPEWLPKQAMGIQEFIKTHKDELDDLRGIGLLAGGPPCQGFSTAGRRNPSDQRNRLFEPYLELVEILEPLMILIENVSAFATTFQKAGDVARDQSFNADEELQRNLRKLGYVPFVRHSVRARDFGVPQLRPRYILIAFNAKQSGLPGKLDPFDVLYASKRDFLLRHRLPTEREVTLEEAISDLLMVHGHLPCPEVGMERFQQGLYGPIKGAYQELMRRRRNGSTIAQGEIADSHRFPNHGPDTVKRFQRILRDFRPGIQLSEVELKSLNLNKHRIGPLSPNEACHTLTSLPDDLVHYCEPRVPTVREYARIQSFPDWFEFKSKYTSGGQRRRVEVPRYTQAANAVPPLLGKAIGETLLNIRNHSASLLEFVGQGNHVDRPDEI